MGYFGRRQVRVEDDLLVTGRGQYVDDLKLTGMLHVALLRSTMAHARLRAVDVSRARAAKGVVAVFTVEDLPPAARLLADCHAHPALAPKELPTLATGKVRYGSCPDWCGKGSGAFFLWKKLTTNRPPARAATGGMRHGRGYQEVRAGA